MSAWQQAIGLFLGTFVSEDLACISAGLLIHANGLHWLVGVLACLLGIFVSDFGLWLAGRLLGGRLLRWEWLRRRLPPQGVERLGVWFETHGWKAVIAARFLPGARLPMYLAAGMLGQRADRFALWTLIAAVLWTPMLVLGVALLGQGIVTPMQSVLGGGWVAFLAAALLLWLAVRIVQRAAAPFGRARLWASVSRIWRWEFWPAWLFYLPLLPWIAWLAIRHRGVMIPTAANPGIKPHGGIVGESKYEILAKLPSEWIVPTALLSPGAADERAKQLSALMSEWSWTYPIILKPDAGQRGAGVRLVRDAESASRYLSQHPQSLVAQAYHPGPFEAGVFYYRIPSEPHGHMLSITDKHFPVLVGDGESTVESLVWRNPRFRMQADTFLARMNGRAGDILPTGARLPLVVAGNHCQGTMFRDGAHLITPELEHTIDAISRYFEGFFFGRFDVRYSDVNELRAGRGFAIIELNGVTSESTNLYDPDWTLLRAYRQLFRQWSLLFQIGACNRSRGICCSRIADVVSDTRAYYRTRAASLASD